MHPAPFVLFVSFVQFAFGAAIAAQEPQRHRLALPLPGERPAAVVDPEVPQHGCGTADEWHRRHAERMQRLDAAATDLAARAERLGAGVEPAFALLRDEIGLDLYSGVLRGAQGTYAQRAGNALDRCLLLADLLRRQGMTVRFVRGVLDDARRAQLLERVFAGPTPGRDDPALATAGAELRALLERVRVRAGRDRAALAGALGKAGVAVVTSREDLLAELRDHHWVQVRRGDAWLDLDPAFAELQPGQRATSPEQTWDALPEELHQHVALQVVVEERKHGAPALRTVLRVQRRACELLDLPVFLAHVRDRRLGRAIAGALGEDGGTPWRPVVFLGSEPVVGEATTFAGAAARASVLDLLGGEAPKPEPAESSGIREVGCAAPAQGEGDTFLAEWLEIELTWPDGRVELHRRALVDRVGAAVRARSRCEDASLARLPQDGEGPLFLRDVHTIALTAGRHDLHAFAEAVQDFAPVAAATDGADGAKTAAPAAAAEPEGPEALWPFALQTLGWMFVSDERLVPALADRAGIRLFAEAPRIWIASLLHLDAEGTRHFVLDQRRDKLRGIVSGPELAGELQERKIWFGLLEGALEHEVLADMAVRGGVDPKLVATTSARVDGRDVATLLPGAGTAAAESIASPLASAQVVAALQRGSTVALPEPAAGEDTAFWELDEQGDLRAVYGLDWNGATVPTAGLSPRPRAGGVPPPKPSYSRGNMTSPVGRGGKAGSNFKMQKGGAAGSEYTTILENVSVPGAIAFAAELAIIGILMAAAGGWL